MFRTDLLSIIRSLNTVYTAIGICHAEILKMGKIIYIYIYMRKQVVSEMANQTHTLNKEAVFLFEILISIYKAK